MIISLKIWSPENGEVKPLTGDGVYSEAFSVKNAFDNDETTYFMSKRSSRETPQGLEIQFDGPKEIVEVLLYTEKNNRHRYKNVCVISDGDFKLACSDHDYQAGEKIKFIKEFHKEFFRTVSNTLKIAWTEEFARITDIKIYYFDPLDKYIESESEKTDSESSFENEIQYWKDCFTTPIAEEKFPFENQGAKENSFENCGLRCIKVPECYAFNWFESDKRCYLRSDWQKSVLGKDLGEMSKYREGQIDECIVIGYKRLSPTFF